MSTRIAGLRPAPYVAGMKAALLTRLLAAFALLLMPLGMAAADPAMAHSAAPAVASHCDDGHEAPADKSRQGHEIDCTIACSALRPVDPVQTAGPSALSPAAPAAIPDRLGGLHPEAAIPPPRRS